MNKYSIAGIVLAALLLIGGYVWYNYSGYWTGNCALISNDERDVCCANEAHDVVVITCEGGWKFDSSINQCAYLCSSG